MSHFHVIPLLQRAPRVAALSAAQDESLLALADTVFQRRTGHSLSARPELSPRFRWAGERLQALALALIDARQKDAENGTGPCPVVGLGLGTVGALALAGCLTDEAALDALLSAAHELAGEPHGVAALVAGLQPGWREEGVEVSPLGQKLHWLEATQEGFAALTPVLAQRGARICGLWATPIGSARRAAALRRALSGHPLRPATRTLLHPASGRPVEQPEQALSDAPFDLEAVERTQRSTVETGTPALTPTSPTPAGSTVATATPGPYIGEIRARDARGFTSERMLSLAREPYLRTAARLKQRSVLPGSFELEIGMEAGRLLHPELVPASIDDAVFHSAMKLFDDQPVCMRLTARSEPLGDGSHRVDLRITSDLVHHSGRLLQKDRAHCDMSIVMRERFDEAPAPMAFDAARAEPEPDVPRVLYQPGSPLWLGPYFEAVWDSRRSETHIQSVYRNPADLSAPEFGSHYGAPLLMDAILQNPLRRSGPLLRVGIPRSIRRVRIFERLNERHIRDQGPLHLTSEVDDALEHCPRMQATAPDGRVVLEVERFELIPLGWIDRRDLSVYRDPAELESRTQARRAVS